MVPFLRSVLCAPIFCIFILIQLSLFSRGSAEVPASVIPENPASEEIEDEKPVALQELYKALDPNLPVLGWIIPDISWNINSSDASHVCTTFLEKVVRKSEYKPVSLMKWYEKEYSKERPRDLLQILSDMKKLKIPVNCLCTIKIRPFSDNYLIVIGLYNVAKSNEKVFVHRILHDLTDNWDKELPEMINELFLRYQQTPITLSSKNIYCESLNVKFYSYYELNNEEFSFTEIPFRNIDGTDYKNDCDLVSDLIAMRLHSSGFTGITPGGHYLLTKKDFFNRPSCTWGLKGEIRISEKISVLKMEVYNYRRKQTVTVFDIPFYGYDSHSIYRLTDIALPFILDSVLTEKEKKKIVYIEKPYINIKSDRLYGPYGYMGPSHLIHTLILPSALSRLLLKKDGFSEVNPWNPALYNVALLVNPSGNMTRIYTQKDILYAEKLFE